MSTEDHAEGQGPITIGGPPPLPPRPKVPWRRDPKIRKTLFIVFASVAAFGIVGTFVSTGFAIRHYDDWAAMSEQNNERADVITVLEADVVDLESELASARESLVPQRQLAQREAEATRREGDVASREIAVKGREDAVSTSEAYIEETSLTNGKYTAGLSMTAGTYRTENTNSRCYWAIYTSGTNYDDIVQNDLGSTGVLTVTIRDGQDFETSTCGTWAKVG